MIGAGRPRESAKCWAKRSGSMVAEVMISLRSGRFGSSCLRKPEDEVDVEAALVGLVDDQRVVALEHPVVLQLGEQDPVGHHLDATLFRRTVREPHLVADGLPQLSAELLGDALGDAARSDPARLGVADHRAALRAAVTAAQREADLGQLRGLSGARLPRDDHHLVVADRLGDVVTTGRDRQVGREVDTHSAAILPRRVNGGRSGSGGGVQVSPATRGILTFSADATPENVRDRLRTLSRMSSQGLPGG